MTEAPKFRRSYHTCKMQLTGRIVSAPTLRFSKQGMPYTTFTVIFDPDKAKEAVFFDMISFREMAETIYAEYIKGDIIKISKCFPVPSKWVVDGKTKRFKVNWCVTELGSTGTRRPKLPPRIPPEEFNAMVEELMFE